MIRKSEKSRQYIVKSYKARKFESCKVIKLKVVTFNFLLLTFYFLLLSTVSHATELPIRGMARGESKIKIGDKAPLLTPELDKAHKQGKVIALMLGFESHCNWCDRMDRYIRIIMKDTNNFDNRAVFIKTQIEHAKMIAPPEEGVRLKEAYGVEGQPWLFIIDKQGIVRFIYKVFVSSDVFERNIKELLGEEKEDHEEKKEGHEK